MTLAKILVSKAQQNSVEIKKKNGKDRPDKNIKEKPGVLMLNPSHYDSGIY